ncbi:MAG: response regulator [Phycisphaeraceae bacterium]|nr:response regulator [Phycisphaeraceae bacterium]MCW5762327.1 response regulator [Phycisphaeraceae bacterium]
MTKGRVTVIAEGMSPEEVSQLQTVLAEQYEVTTANEAPVVELIANSLVEGIVLCGEQGGLLWSNSYFGALDEATRARIIDVCSEAISWFVSRVGQGEVPLRDLMCKFDVGSEDGRRLYEVFVTPAKQRVDEGALCNREDVSRVAAVLRDVTRERSVQAKMEAIDRAGYELVRLDAEAVRAMNSMQRLQLLESKIVRYMREVLHYDHFAIFLIEERSRKLELVISTGLPQEIQHLNLVPEADGSGISGFVAATGQSYICQDAQSDELFLPGLVGARSSLTVPLLLHDQVIGIIDIESQQPRAFDEEDRRFVEIFARHVALALHMLDLLVVERCATNENVTGRVEGELNEPLDDILHEVEWLGESGKVFAPEAAAHIARIRADVESIRQRVKEVASGPQTLLGVDRALAERTQDPILIGRRVLVTDDAPKIRKVIGEVLKSKGCDVTIAACGEEAIQALHTRQAEQELPFDLVISDIQMPDRNGYEVFAAAKAVNSETSVILMTGFGYDPHHSIVRASQEGLTAVIFKPFEIEALLEQIRKALAPKAD